MKKAHLVVFALALALTCAFAGGSAFAEDSALTGGTIAQGAADSGSSAAQPAKKAANPKVSYKAYVGNAWTSGWKSQGASLGTQNKMIQLLKVKVAGDGIKGGVKYRIYSKYKGWQAWKSNGGAVGTKNWRMRGIQMKLTSTLAKRYDIMYRVYLHGQGWRPWVVDGATAGSTGKLGEIEKIQVKLVQKDAGVQLADGAYFITAAKNGASALAVPKAKTGNGVQLAKAAFSDAALAERFMVRNEGNSVLIQSCASGKYLCEKNGKVVQRALSGAANFRWNVAWNAGYAIVNAATGHGLKLKSGKAVALKSPARWVLTSTDCLPEGIFTFKNVAAGTLLTVKGASKANKANVIVQAKKSAAAQAFELERVGLDTYRVKNASSGKGLEVENGSKNEGANVRQNALKSISAQKWKVTLDPSGTYKLVNKASGKALTAAGGGATGANAISAADTGAAVQRWSVAASNYKPVVGSGNVAVDRAVEYAKTATSATNYFITVDLTNHWVCIFQGARGGRALVKSWLCSTGAPGSGTPTGEYVTGYKQYEFGTGYSCYYATAFIGYEYLFHSVKYYKNTFNVMDGRLGASISEGCIRLNIENAKWIYNYIPSSTKVKIYY